MELSIIRRETTGAAPNQYNESETLVRFEVRRGPCVEALVDGMSVIGLITCADHGRFSIQRGDDPNTTLSRRI
jgi:hypothetical protein